MASYVECPFCEYGDFIEAADEIPTEAQPVVKVECSDCGALYVVEREVTYISREPEPGELVRLVRTPDAREAKRDGK